MRRPQLRRLLSAPVFLIPILAGGAAQRAQEACGPFTDVAPALCPFVAELYYTGITAGTSPTAFSPGSPMTRSQAAVFVARGLNQSLARSDPRAALGQWWTTTPHWDIGLGTTAVGDFPALPQSDGADIWVPNILNDTVSRVRASDGRLLETWTGAQAPAAVCVALGRIFVTGSTIPGKLYMIDPASALGDVTVVSELGNSPGSIAFDGERL